MRPEIGARLVERRRRAVLAFATLGSRIEAATPFPWLGVVRIADTLNDRAGVNIAVVDLPAFLAMVRRPAAGECGHAPMIPPI